MPTHWPKCCQMQCHAHLCSLKFCLQWLHAACIRAHRRAMLQPKDVRTRGFCFLGLSACRFDGRVILVLFLFLFINALATLLSSALHGQHVLFFTVAAAASLQSMLGLNNQSSCIDPSVCQHEQCISVNNACKSSCNDLHHTLAA